VNTPCAVLIAILLVTRYKLAPKQIAVAVMSLNITLADSIVSLCLLSISIYNLSFEGTFGAYADQWRQSFQCISLEFLMFVSTKCSLIYTIYLSVATYFQITSLLRTSKPIVRYYMESLAILGSVVVAGISKHVVYSIHDANELNYYCLPFQVTTIKHLGILIAQIIVLLLDVVLVASYIATQTLLMRYIRRHVKETSNTFTTKINDRKVAIRTSCMITCTLLTWSPILVTQLCLLFGHDIDPSTVFLIALTSLPANLLVHPILQAFPFLRTVIK
jgi:hypothetical protein